MIDYIIDTDFGSRAITEFPHKLEGMLGIFHHNKRFMRCPSWGRDKTILGCDENYVYVQSDIVGKVDVFDEEGVKVKEINVEDL